MFRSHLASIVTVLVALPVCASSGWGQTPPEDPRPVAAVDLERYAGLWYEIARIPNRFQRGCASGTTASYALRDDHRIDVVNACREADGDIDRAVGLAQVVDPETNARLEVSFFSILGWRPVWGDYWILGLDEDYRWAIVGTPDREYGWILARDRRLPPGEREAIDRLLREQGYDPDRFLPTRQVSSPGWRRALDGAIVLRP